MAAAIPTRWQALLFEAKAWVFRSLRFAREAGRRPRRHRPAHSLVQAPVLAASTTALWSQAETSPGLVAGKIHNLRRALRGLHGIEVPAGQTLGFWRQVGRATRLRGYARGRELREGCLVPSVGGGLCQLSNAIYDAALRAGLEIVERHRHSRVVPGSLAEHDRDAVVFWNYRDLRLRAATPWRLEAWMDAERLHVRIRGRPATAPVPLPIAPAARGAAMQVEDDCGSCGQDDCHRHAPGLATASGRTWLVDEDWPEFAAYRRQAFAAGDRIVGVREGWRMSLAGLQARALRRWRLWRGDPLPKARLRGHRLLARALARRLGAADTRLVVPQSLLPHLWASGELQGRRFEVWMTALPMAEIQRRLDLAHRQHPHSPTLGDFRADAALMRAEAQALAQAERWISPHAGILALAGTRALTLPWSMPSADATRASVAAHELPRVLLASSPLARKGALELREALRGLPLQLVLPPGAQEAPELWDGIAVVRAPSMADGIAGADVVVLPAWIEHQPRGLLLALALGKPVVASDACGLARDGTWHCVEAGDAQGLRAAILQALVAADA